MIQTHVNPQDFPALTQMAQQWNQQSTSATSTKPHLNTYTCFPTLVYSVTTRHSPSTDPFSLSLTLRSIIRAPKTSHVLVVASERISASRSRSVGKDHQKSSGNPLGFHSSPIRPAPQTSFFAFFEDKNACPLRSSTTNITGPAVSNEGGSL